MTRKEAIKVLTYLREIIKTTPKVLCKLPNVEERKKENIIALRMAIEALSADRPQGEWLEVEDCIGDVHYKCDQCGVEWTFPCGTPKDNTANFCPKCGADMRGEK